MDHYSSGMDPEVKRYFRKIIATVSAGLLWLLSIGTAGFFFRLAIIQDQLRWYNTVFYVVFLLTLVVLIWFFYRVWKKNKE